MAKKSAWEKMRCGKRPKVVLNLPAALQKWFPPGTPQEARTMLVSCPEEVESFIASLAPGRCITLSELRAELARRHDAAIACPLSTAIFVNLVARAYAEREAETGKESIGWWRVLGAGGKLNPKFPGGTAEQRRRLAEEGILLP